MSTKEVLKKHSVKLIKTLPIDNSIFLEILDQYKILPGDSRDKIQAKEIKADKASYYIHQVIEVSTDLYLPRLLNAMKHYYKECTDIALEILVMDMETDMRAVTTGTYVCMLFTTQWMLAVYTCVLP